MWSKCIYTTERCQLITKKYKLQKRTKTRKCTEQPHLFFLHQKQENKIIQNHNRRREPLKKLIEQGLSVAQKKKKRGSLTSLKTVLRNNL